MSATSATKTLPGTESAKYATSKSWPGVVRVLASASKYVILVAEVATTAFIRCADSEILFAADIAGAMVSYCHIISPKFCATFLLGHICNSRHEQHGCTNAIRITDSLSAQRRQLRRRTVFR